MVKTFKAVEGDLDLGTCIYMSWNLGSLILALYIYSREIEDKPKTRYTHSSDLLVWGIGTYGRFSSGSYYSPQQLLRTLDAILVEKEVGRVRNELLKRGWGEFL